MYRITLLNWFRIEEWKCEAVKLKAILFNVNTIQLSNGIRGTLYRRQAIPLSLSISSVLQFLI